MNVMSPKADYGAMDRYWVYMIYIYMHMKKMTMCIWMIWECAYRWWAFIKNHSIPNSVNPGRWTTSPSATRWLGPSAHLNLVLWEIWSWWQRQVETFLSSFSFPNLVFIIFSFWFSFFSFLFSRFFFNVPPCWYVIYAPFLGRTQQKLGQMKKNNMKKHEHENYKTWWKKWKTKTNLEKHILNFSSL